MPTLLMFATAREASGKRQERFDAATLAELLELACAKYGELFADVLSISRVWINGEEPSSADVALAATDVIAVIPPIAGG
jgi:molybdopterin synthase sulfur carrier subunit